MAAQPKNLTVKVDNLHLVKTATKLLTNADVLVGVPDSTADRSGTGTQINNATLAYIHDNGSPAMNIPARPFMRPGIENAQDGIAAQFKQAGQDALSGNSAAVLQRFNSAGLLAQASIKKKIVEGPFVPLAPRTLAARRAKGMLQDKPLIETSRMLNSISYVVRTKGQ